jgi:hypothetical protein
LRSINSFEVDNYFKNSLNCIHLSNIIKYFVPWIRGRRIKNRNNLPSPRRTDKLLILFLEHLQRKSETSIRRLLILKHLRKEKTSSLSNKKKLTLNLVLLNKERNTNNLPSFIRQHWQKLIKNRQIKQIQLF